MLSKASANPSEISSVVGDEGTFLAERWLKYFQANRESQAAITYPDGIDMAIDLRLQLVLSLQRFQLGETGEGHHLRAYAREMKDADFEKCIDLFVKEEQSHARILAEMINALDGTVITAHWTALAFTVLRRLFGLKTEIFVLLIGEIVGKVFYMECARHVDDVRMSDAFSILVLDEMAHLEFLCEFLHSKLVQLPDVLRYAIFWGWSSIFYAACCVFILDHKRTLVALGIPRKKFMQECSISFRRAAQRALQV